MKNDGTTEPLDDGKLRTFIGELRDIKVESVASTNTANFENF